MLMQVTMQPSRERGFQTLVLTPYQENIVLARYD